MMVWVAQQVDAAIDTNISNFRHGVTSTALRLLWFWDAHIKLTTIATSLMVQWLTLPFQYQGCKSDP